MSAASRHPQDHLGRSDIQTSIQLQADELQSLNDHAPNTRRRVTRPTDTPEEAHTLPRVESVDYSRYRYTGAIRKWWNRHVSVAVSIQHRRDHLALERTFLGYVRTSIAFSMLGVVIAQLLRLQHSINPSIELGFFKVAVPLAAVFEAMAIIVTLLGACRFWRQQHAMLGGKVWASGWEVKAIMVLSILLCIALFVLVLAIDIKKGYV